MKKLLLVITILGIVFTSCKTNDDPKPASTNTLTVSTASDGNYALHFVQNDGTNPAITDDSLVYYISVPQFNYRDTLKLYKYDIVDTVIYFKSNLATLDEVKVTTKYGIEFTCRLVSNEYAYYLNLYNVYGNYADHEFDVLPFPIKQ